MINPEILKIVENREKEIKEQQELINFNKRCYHLNICYNCGGNLNKDIVTERYTDSGYAHIKKCLNCKSSCEIIRSDECYEDA